MTSLSCGVEALLRAAEFLEEQELGHQHYRPIVVESSSISTEEIKPTIESTPPPSQLVVISRPPVQFIPQPMSIDLSKSSSGSNPLTTLSNGTGSSITVYSYDEAPSLNVSAESSGYISNSTTSSLGNVSLNQSASHGVDDIGSDLEKSVQLLDQRLPIPSSSTAFNALPMPTSTIPGGRRRTISSNSNSGTLRSPSTVRAGTREVHNKLEKNRRAHLKECFEALKKQLPITADEKKTSNLSILGAAIRHIQLLKRKEREYEHEMERLAKEKIAAQNRILYLKRELAQWDIDYSKLLPEQTDISAVKSERGEPSNDPSGKNSVKYSSTSSLSSITSSACASNVASSTNLSPNIISTSSAPASPPRMTMITTNSSLVPLPLTKSNIEDMQAKVSINPIKMVPITSSPHSKPNMSITPSSMNNGAGNHNSMPSSLNLKGNESPLIQSMPMPLNLHATSSTATIIPQPLNGLKNGLKGYNSKEKTSKSPVSNIITSSSACITPAQVSSTTSNKMDEPPTKLIKLINGNAILAPMDKDNNKMMHSHSGPLTLQQVVGGGGLVVSPIQLLASSQSFKVIGQSNGLTTIELSTPQINGQPTGMQQRSHHLGPVQQSAQLQKLLMNGNGTTSSTTNISIPAMNQQQGTITGHRLAPGGAELNLLPSNSTTNNGAIYRNQAGKLALVKETNNSSRVHVVQSTPHIVVSQSQSGNLTHHIIASSPQLTGKMMSTSGAQYLSTIKPMVVMNHHNGSPTNDAGKGHI